MKLKYILHSIALVVICVGLMGANPSLDARFNDVGHRLMCKCGCNQILLECNHVGCSYSTKMRDQLTAALKRGDSDGLILDGFVQEYGSTVLAAPTTTGFNIVAWIMPFFALVAGLTLVTVVIRKWKFRVAPVGAQNLSEVELDEFRRRAREETNQ
jgi:cytochrome c-type biogenesis protein CcmH/NrfF